jgi:hypothetical protein
MSHDLALLYPSFLVTNHSIANSPANKMTQPPRPSSSQTMLCLLFAIASIGSVSAKSASAEMAGSFAMSRECEFLPATFDFVGHVGCPPGYACVEQLGSSLGGICKEEEEQVVERVLQTVDPLCNCPAKKCCGSSACLGTDSSKIPVGSCCGSSSCNGLGGETNCYISILIVAILSAHML